MSYKVYRHKPSKGYKGKPTYFKTLKEAKKKMKVGYSSLTNAKYFGWRIKKVQSKINMRFIVQKK